MQERWEQLMRSAKGIALTPEEKARGRVQLREFMALRPVRNGEDARQNMATKPLGFMNIFTKKKFMPIFGLMLALMLAGGGVSYAAEGTVPGDVLYAVKLHVNENVGSALAVSAEAKAKWEARLAERRLEEAEMLAADGRLDAEVRTQLEEKFRTHAEKAQKRTEKVAEKRGPEASATLSAGFEASLKAHKKVLAKLSADAEMDGEAGMLADAVGEEADEAKGDREDAEDDLEEKVNAADKERAAQGRSNAAQKKIAETEAYIAKREAKLGADAAAEARAVLAQADDLVQQGFGLIEEGDFGGAFRMFQEAHVLAGRAKVTLVMSAKLGISVSTDDDDGEKGNRGRGEKKVGDDAEDDSRSGDADDEGGESDDDDSDSDEGTSEDTDDDDEDEDDEEVSAAVDAGLKIRVGGRNWRD